MATWAASPHLPRLRPWTRAAVLALLMAVPTLCSRNCPAEPPTAPEQAIALHDEAKALYARGLYNDALVKLEEALALDPNAAELHYNLALIHEKLGELDDALEHYRAVLALEQNRNEQQRLEAIIQRLEGARGHTPLGRPAPRRAPLRQPVGPRRERSVSPWLYVTAGISGAGLIGGAVLAAHASGMDPGRRPTTGPGVSYASLRDDAEAANRSAVGADIAFGVGLTAAVATVVMALVMHGDDNADDNADEDDQPPEAAEARLHFRPAQLAVAF